MHLGIKLAMGFSEDESHRRLYGDRAILEYLRNLGIDAVETPIGPNVDERKLLDHARVCTGSGFRVSLHPYTEGSPSNPARFENDEENPCRRAFERIFSLASSIADMQEAQTVVNIHPAAGPRASSRRLLVDQSVRFFAWVLEWCRANAPRLLPVAELQIGPEPEEEIQRIGDRLDELCEIVVRSGIGACWDFGHGYMNWMRFGVPLDPPEELLSRISHVHCHDVDGEDHQPLIFNKVPWKRFMEELKANGFDGTVILEIPPDNLMAAGGLQALEETVNAFRMKIS